MGKRTSDWPLSLALCWNVLDFSQCLHLLVCRVSEIVMNDSLEDREQVECCHFRGIEIHSSSEVEGPNEKPAPAGVRVEENLILSNELIEVLPQLKI